MASCSGSKEEEFPPRSETPEELPPSDAGKHPVVNHPSIWGGYVIGAGRENISRDRRVA